MTIALCALVLEVFSPFLRYNERRDVLKKQGKWAGIKALEKADGRGPALSAPVE